LAGRIRPVALIERAGVAVVRAGRSRIPRRVLAERGRAVALIERAGVAVARTRGPARCLGVDRAGRAQAVAHFMGIARTRRSAALGPRVARRVLARRARAVALVQCAGVAVVGAGGSARLEQVGWAVGGRARAVLGGVAQVHGGTADG